MNGQQSRAERRLILLASWVRIYNRTIRPAGPRIMVFQDIPFTDDEWKRLTSSK